MMLTIPKPAPSPELPAPAATDPVHFAVRRIYEEFARKLPPGAEGPKGYRTREGDAFSNMAPPTPAGAPSVTVPDGTYRVVGGDWLLTFKQNRLASAIRATAENNFGGSAVKHVPPAQPSQPERLDHDQHPT